MSLLVADSFDHYVTADVLKKGWASIGLLENYVISSTGGRRGTAGLRFAAANAATNWVTTLARAFTSAATVVFGFGYKTTELDTEPACWAFALGDGATTQLCFVPVVPSGALEVYRGDRTTLLGTTAAGVINWNIYNYIEVKATIDNAAGVVVVRINGTQVLNLTGQDTQATANAYANYLAVGSRSTTAQARYSYFDDLVILNTSGGAPQNDFLGDVSVLAQFPNGEGNHTAWTPSNGATHYVLVDESAPNESDYVESYTAGQKDSYAFQNIALTSGTIFGVQLNLAARRNDSGTRQVKHLARVSGTDYLGTAKDLTTEQSYVQHIWEQNPNTASAWTETTVNAAEFGAECQ